METSDGPLNQPATNDPSAVSAWMANAVAADPRLQLMMTMIQNANAQPPAAEREKDIARLRRQHAQARRRLTVLAAALGACPKCWGERLECDACRGIGAPGAFDPDPAAFARFVLPVARRLRAARAGTAQHSPAAAAGTVDPLQAGNIGAATSAF